MTGDKAAHCQVRWLTRNRCWRFALNRRKASRVARQHFNDRMGCGGATGISHADLGQPCRGRQTAQLCGPRQALNMGRRRTSNHDLPPSLHMKGERYYHVTSTAPRKWTPLGKNRPRALMKWARIEGTESVPAVRTFDVVSLRYEREVMPTKAPRTQRDNLIELDKLRAVFGRMLIDSLKPHHVRGYLDARGQTAKARANRERALLSHLFNTAREWGYTDATNPSQGVKGFTEAGRDRDVTDAEFQAVWAKDDPTLQDAMDIALLTGQRPADVLKILRTDIRDGALFVTQNKTGAKRGIEIVGELAEVIARINARKRDRLSMHLIQDDIGRPLSQLAMRGRFDKARREAGVDFQFRDTRAKTASDAGDLGHAQKLLGHKNREMTEHYVRERIGQRVKPLR